MDSSVHLLIRVSIFGKLRPSQHPAEHYACRQLKRSLARMPSGTVEVALRLMRIA
jgi:hypothetical protein